jgi:hypothetical protein
LPVCRRPHDRNRTPHGLRDSLSGRHPLWSSGIPFWLSGSFTLQLYVGSSSLSLSLLVHGFLCPSDATGASRLHFLVIRVLSSTPLPGFTGPESSVLSVNLPPSGPYPLRGLLIGVGFLTSLTAFDVRPGGLPWVRRTTSPYPVQLHFGSVHRILGLALPRLLDLLPAAI